MASLETYVQPPRRDELERLTVLEAPPARPLALLALERAVQAGQTLRCELRGVRVERAVLPGAGRPDVEPGVGRASEVEADACERVGLEAAVELGIAARQARQPEQETRLGDGQARPRVVAVRLEREPRVDG